MLQRLAAVAKRIVNTRAPRPLKSADEEPAAGDEESPPQD
jgi:hypothetical protein